MEPTFWGKLISDLQEEHGVSERQLARMTKVNRNTIRNFKTGRFSISFAHLENILAVFGYVIEPMPANPDQKREGGPCRMLLHPSAHVVA